MGILRAAFSPIRICLALSLSLYPIPYNIYPHPPQKYAARIFYVDSGADVLKCAKIIIRFFRTFPFGTLFFVRRYT